MYVKVYAKTEMTATQPTTVSVAALIPYSAPGGTPDKWYALWCRTNYDSSTDKYTATVSVYDTTVNISSLSAKDFDDATAFGATSNAKYSVSTVATYSGTRALTASAAASPNVADYTVLWGAEDTWVQFANDNKTLEFQISFKRENLATTAPADQFTVINSQIGATKISYFTVISSASVTSQ